MTQTAPRCPALDGSVWVLVHETALPSDKAMGLQRGQMTVLVHGYCHLRPASLRGDSVPWPKKKEKPMSLKSKFLFPNLGKDLFFKNTAIQASFSGAPSTPGAPSLPFSYPLRFRS